jgi:Baseplate J-like protein
VSAAWWGREAGPSRRARIVPGPGPAGVQPELVEASAERVRAAVRSRISGFTADWTNPDPADAGVALVRLFGTQVEPLLRRVNRLPEKALVEVLGIAGIGRLPATAATALLGFTVSPAATASVLVPAGFQAGADPATGEGDLVVFETDRLLHATPATLAAVAVEERGLVTEVDVASGRPFVALGSPPRPGNALWVGLALDPSSAPPYPSLSLGFVAVDPPGSPLSAASGGTIAPPLLRWEVLDGGRLVGVAVRRDETDGLRRGGVVELATPRRWQPGHPRGGPGLPEGRWLRVGLDVGEYPIPPLLVAVVLNAARALAARTFRDEALERLPDQPADGLERMTVTQTPVLPGSLVIEVDDDPAGDLFGVGVGRPAEPRRWREVDSLAAYGPDDPVFVADHATGVITFGDGVHGARVPPGFRNVRAAVYRAGGGAAGAVDAGAVSVPLTSVGLVTEVTNPFPASGGVDTEPQSDAVNRGAEQLRARDRAVTPADYATLARRAPGAEVARAHGVAGLHPDHPGVPIPGVVGVLVVPPDRTTGSPPLPTAAELEAVAAFLVREAAPAGVQVVTAAPRYHLVAVEARIVLDPAEDQADVIRAATAALDRYLHPLTGGESGSGWPFGGALRHVALVRRLLEVSGIRAVPQLHMVVDGLRQPAEPACADHPITAHALVWPAAHELIPVEREERP